MESEKRLHGGRVTGIVRVGDTVRRPAARPFVRRLLPHLGDQGWTGAPRLLGVDERGRDVLEHIAGHVAWADHQPPDVRADASLVAMARVVRALHDLTAGTALTGDGRVV